ncbi:MAG: universal stress protein [Arenicellales bacterium]|nr:universal stress protein [Arenicellales bacterium]
MSIATILAHVDNSSANENRFKAAVALTKEFEAHLIALFIVPTYTIPVYAEVPIGAEVIKTARQAMLESAAQAKSTCENIASSSGVSFEWRLVEGNVINTLNEHARYCDLVVLGQSNPSDLDDMSTEVADHVVLEAGAPCLVVPYIGVKKELPDNVMLAWNGSMESARAAKDALPLMKRAQHVEVLLINPEQGEVDEGDIPGADIGAYLARHGIKAETNCVHNKQISAGDILLSQAADLSTDLLVTGAYGHTRLRERILGGVTHHLLEHMTVPVFMSH